MKYLELLLLFSVWQHLFGNAGGDGQQPHGVISP